MKLKELPKKTKAFIADYKEYISEERLLSDINKCIDYTNEDLIDLDHWLDIISLDIAIQEYEGKIHVNFYHHECGLDELGKHLHYFTIGAL